MKSNLTDDAHDPQSLRNNRLVNVRQSSRTWHLPADNADDLTAGDKSATFVTEASSLDRARECAQFVVVESSSVLPIEP